MKEGFPTLPPAETGYGEKPPVFNPYKKLGEAINNAAHDQALDIMDLAVTEEALLQKLEITEHPNLVKAKQIDGADLSTLSDEKREEAEAFSEAAKEYSYGGNISELRGITFKNSENISDEEAGRLVEIYESIGRENFLDLIKTSHALVRSELGEGADVDAGEKPVPGIAGVTKAIEAKIESRNEEIGQIKKMIRARGGDVGELQAKIDELESQNETSKTGLERVIEKVRKSELERNSITRQRVEGRVRKNLSDIDEFEFWGAKYPESSDSDSGDTGSGSAGEGGSRSGPGDDGETGGGDDSERLDPTEELSGPVTEILGRLEERVAEVRSNYAEMLSGRKGVSFFSAKFSQKKVTAAQLEYTDARNALLDEEFTQLTENGMSEEEATTLINQALLMEAGSLLNEQVNNTLKHAEGSKIRKFFQKWEDGKMSIIGKAMALVGPGTAAGVTTGLVAGVASGRPLVGAAVGAATAVPVAGKTGDYVLQGLNDSTKRIRVPKLNEDGEHEVDETGEPVYVTRGRRKENLQLRLAMDEVQRIVRESNEAGQDATIDIDDAIYAFAVNKLREPGVSRTRKAVAAAAIAAATGAGLFGAAASSSEQPVEAPQAEQPSANEVLESTTTTEATESTTSTSEAPEDSNLTPEQQEFIDSLSEEETVEFTNFINWVVEYQEQNPTLTTDSGTVVEVGTPEYEAEMQLRWNRYFENLEESNS